MFRTLTTSRRFGGPNILAFLRAIWRLVFRLEVVGPGKLAPVGAPNIIVGRSCLLARCADPVLAHGDAGDFRDRAGRSQELAGAALSSIRRCARARSRQAARLTCARARGEARTAARSVPRHASRGRRPVDDIFRRRGADCGEVRRIVTAVRLAGAERTFFSRIAAAYVGRRLFPKIKVTILPPRRLLNAIRPARSARRQARRLALYDRMAELQFLTFDIRRTLHAAFEASGEGARPLARGGRRSAERRHEPAHVSHRRRRAGAQDRRLCPSPARRSA